MTSSSEENALRCLCGRMPVFRCYPVGPSFEAECYFCSKKLIANDIDKLLAWWEKLNKKDNK